LKSIEATAPVAASRATSASSQLGVASSLKRTPGYAARRRSTGSGDGGSPIRSETTKETGCGSRPSTSASERPAWRSPRSAAADSNAQRR
jgi:hypothetical protein